MLDTKEMKVESPIGEVSLDAAGPAIAVAKMDTGKAYTGIPELLKSYINDGDEQAWEEVKSKIDYLYDNLGRALSLLDEEAGLGSKILPQIGEGKKLLFKPNLVSPETIDPVTHGQAGAIGACTQWPFVAALMRWFHDELDITYHQMAVGEAGTAFPGMAVTYGARFNGGKSVPTESIFEGRRGDFYGGWGFYFVRKYLSDTHEASHEDDPMNGYEESVSGEQVPPGRAGDRLMIYDLNRVRDPKSKARVVPVPGGVNYKEITLHKAVIGGDPNDADDMRDYPGCVLVNVPRLKPHIHEPLTNAIKNLGIGLYPMEATVDDDPESTQWRYSVPNKYPPSQKAGLPHEVWQPEIDEATGLPARDENGKYIVTKTGGLKGTIADVVKATENQGVLMLHVVSAIEPLGRMSNPEGFAYASFDPIALDLLCYRSTCKSVPVKDARRLQKENGLPTDFVQEVPLPTVDGSNIVTEQGYDTPISRSDLLRYAESRGLGQLSYHVVGWDALADGPLASVEGHLGRIDGQTFTEVMTPQLRHQGRVMLWGLQTTTLGYFRANDILTGSSYLTELLGALDENGDGVLDYEETGKKGYEQMFETWLGNMSHQRITEEHGSLRGSFFLGARNLRYSNPAWNAQRHDFCREAHLASAAALAFGMSRAETEEKDALFPEMTWGKGKWPSVQHACAALVRNAVYGAGGPGSVSLGSLYGSAFRYADKTLNGDAYTGGAGPRTDPEAIGKYLKAVSGGAPTLDFVLYVPKGYGVPDGTSLPNLEETEDPDKVLTASFNGGQEVWR